MFGLDEIYIELLNEAKSPEEIRKILHYQFVDSKGVPEDIFNAVLSVDPTKKKNYTRWVLMQWENSAKQISHAVKMGQIKELFDYFKERSGSGLELGNMKSFFDAISAVPSIVKDPIFGLQNVDNEKEDDFNIVYDSSEWRIAVPNTVEASVKLGKGCRWCTAGAYGRPEYYYNEYGKAGKLWVNFDKRSSEITPMDKREYPYKRYQFCFEANNGPELMDSSNERIDVEVMDIPSDVFEFYGEQDEEYVSILENATDGEIAAERRREIMLNNCILRKPGNGNYNDLLLLPIVSEYGEPTDVYSFYSENDLSDPVWDAEYNGYRSIVDECEGFPVVFMESTIDTDSRDVYFEESRNYNLWNGETETRYLWNIYENVDLCGGNNDIKYFKEKYSATLIVSFGPRTTDYVKKDINELLGYAGDVDEFREVRFNGELPNEFKNSIWIQVIFDNGYCGLWCINKYYQEVISIIKKDIPYDGYSFELINDGENCYIRSKTRKYVLSGESDETENFSVDSHLENDDNYCVVTYDSKDHTTNKCGLFDLSTKELIIKDVNYIDDYGECVLLSYYDYCIFYDYKNRRFVSGKCEQPQGLGYTSLVGYIPYNENHYRIFDTETLEDHGPFDIIEKVYSNEIVLVKNKGVENLYSTEHKTYVLPDGSNLLKYNYLPKTLFIYELNGKNYLYCSIDNETIMELSNPISFTEFNSTQSSFHQTYTVKLANNKYVVINSFGEVLTKVGADDIIPAVNQTKYSYPNAIVKNSTVYFIFNGSVAMPKNGIPLNNFLKYAIIDSKEKWNNILVGLSIDSGRFKVKYSPFYNRIESVSTADDSPVTDPMALKEIEKLFFPEKAQIQEQFKNIIDRMDIL